MATVSEKRSIDVIFDESFYRFNGLKTWKPPTVVFVRRFYTPFFSNFYPGRIYLWFRLCLLSMEKRLTLPGFTWTDLFPRKTE